MLICMPSFITFVCLYIILNSAAKLVAPYTDIHLAVMPTTVFHWIVIAGTINFSACQDAGAKQGRELFKGGNY